MTERQIEIKKLVEEGFGNIKDIAVKLGTTERGVKISVSKTEGLYCDEKGNLNIIVKHNDFGRLTASGDDFDIYPIESKDHKLQDFELEIEQLKARIKEIEDRNKIKVINLTAHPVVVDNGRVRTTYAPSGTVCRLNLQKEIVDTCDGIRVTQTKTIDLINFPNKENEIYIVSGMVGRELDKRGFTNYVIPHTKSAKMFKGKIISVSKFWRY